MAKKRSCQNVREPPPLNAVEMGLYGWVEGAVFTQPSVIPGDALPKLHRDMMLAADLASEGDYVLEAAGPSDRLPFRAERGDDALPRGRQLASPEWVGLYAYF
ncbi:hypothetical protein PIB30_047100 [Stylosanthes scabra]|uniref:Uncharacterized protein n=1 Tax=Stylosanthes scabra TaxID=79078 RepID=A0ABU6YGU9_9FABA|nr:hypothetical protein [Stylosanthes scabra]